MGGRQVGKLHCTQDWGLDEDRKQTSTIHSKPPFDFHDPSIPASTQRSLAGLIADSSFYYTRVTDGVKRKLGHRFRSAKLADATDPLHLTQRRKERKVRSTSCGPAPTIHEDSE